MGLEDILTSVLYQNGYTYRSSSHISNPASGPTADHLAKPSISQGSLHQRRRSARCASRAVRNEVVRRTGTGLKEPTNPQVQVLEPADYYPTDDEEPATLEADYSTERETDDIEWSTSPEPPLTCIHARSQATPRCGCTSQQEPTKLDPTKARIQLYNNLTYDVSLRNIRVLAGIAYYRNWSALYEDMATEMKWASSAGTATAGIYRGVRRPRVLHAPRLHPRHAHRTGRAPVLASHP